MKKEAFEFRTPGEVNLRQFGFAGFDRFAILLFICINNRCIMHISCFIFFNQQASFVPNQMEINFLYEYFIYLFILSKFKNLQTLTYVLSFLPYLLYDHDLFIC